MLRNTEKHTKSLSTNAPMQMQTLCGSCPREYSKSSPVVGRLVPDSCLEAFSGNEAIIAVVYDLRNSTATGDLRTVGIVRIAEGTEDMAGRLSCPSIILSELPSECKGRIALLDPVAQRLYVSPDIVTVNRYTPLLCSANISDARQPLFMPDGKRIMLSVIPNGKALFQSDADGYALRPDTTGRSEDELFLLYRDIAEKAVGQTVTVSLSSDERLSYCLRALMRGAVWGETSLCLCDILTENELKKALECFNKTFCELEAEGREFNGYLPRALLIDTPYLLLRSERLLGVDCFIYDAERLTALFCGDRQTPPDELFEELVAHIRRLIDSRRDIRHSVILGNRTLCPKLCGELLNCGISDYTVPQDKFDEAYNILSFTLR